MNYTSILGGCMHGRIFCQEHGLRGYQVAENDNIDESECR